MAINSKTAMSDNEEKLNRFILAIYKANYIFKFIRTDALGLKCMFKTSGIGSRGKQF